MAQAQRYIDVERIDRDILEARKVPSLAGQRRTTRAGTPLPAVSNVTLDPAGYSTLVRGQKFGNQPPRWITLGPNDSKLFQGFPSFFQKGDGTYVVFFEHSTTHGNVDAETWGVESSDAGGTWTDPTRRELPGLVRSDASLGGTPRFSYMHRFRSGKWAGRIFWIYTWDIEGDPPQQTPFDSLFYSDDEGASWVGPFDCSDEQAPHITWHIGGHPIQLADGTLLLAGYAHISGSPHYVSTCMQSLDGGRTWTRRSTIMDGSDYGGGDEKPEEPCLLLLDTGRILCTVREDGEWSGGTVSGTIRTFYSDDDGVTWVPIVDEFPGAFGGAGRPALVQTASGTVLCFTRESYQAQFWPGAPIIRASRDRGLTWSEPLVLDDVANNVQVYGDFEEVSPNVVALVYGAQVSATDFTASDVRWRYLLDGDGVSPLGGVKAAVVRADRFIGGNLADEWQEPPRLGDADTLLTYLHNRGLVPVHPLDIPSTTGLWEADAIPNTVNDWTAGFASDTNLSQTNGATPLAITERSGNWVVDSGQLQNDTYEVPNVGAWNVGATNGSWKASFVLDSGAAEIGLTARGGAAGNLYFALTTGNVRLYKWISGTGYTQLDSHGSSINTGTSYTAEIVCTGNLIECYYWLTSGSKPASPQISYTLIGADLTDGSGILTTGTEFGCSTSDTGARFDTTRCSTSIWSTAPALSAT